MRSMKDLVRRTSGEVTFEMLFVFLPLFAIFASLVQFSQTATADLTVRHSAVVAVRTAIVTLEKDGNNPGNNGPDSDVVAAAALSMGPFFESGAISDIDVRWTDSSTARDPHGKICVEVSARYRCRVPFGNVLTCGGRWRALKAAACMPHQGARYKT
jgi:hypothetical protein